MNAPLPEETEVTREQPQPGEYFGEYRNGVIRLSGPVSWPDGTPVRVQVSEIDPHQDGAALGKVIIGGFGLSGRWVAGIFDRHKIDYVIIESNPETIATQHKLGRKAVEGSVTSEETLHRAGILDASVLVLTITDENAVIEATRIARAIKPGIYIVARTTHSSAGLRALACGADEVIKAEQVVARQFYEMLLRKIGIESRKAENAACDAT